MNEQKVLIRIFRVQTDTLLFFTKLNWINLSSMVLKVLENHQETTIGVAAF